MKASLTSPPAPIAPSTLLAYIDIFFGYAMLAAVLVPVAFIPLRPSESRAPDVR
jgi:hypothetical protein